MWSFHPIELSGFSEILAHPGHCNLRLGCVVVKGQRQRTIAYTWETDGSKVEEVVHVQMQSLVDLKKDGGETPGCVYSSMDYLGLSGTL